VSAVSSRSIDAITGHTRVAGVIGWPIEHSLSPTIHNAGFTSCGADWIYTAFPVPSGHCAEMLELCRRGAIGGLSVTMPHKTDVFALVDRVSPAAASLRSVNTVAVEPDGTLVGHSTDGDGLVDSLLADGVDPAGRSILVLGWGGAARSVVDALTRHGSGSITVTNRSGVDTSELSTIAPTATACDWSARDDAVTEHDVVINCTSVGMGDDARVPVDATRLAPTCVVVDLVYHPLRTPFLNAAESQGCRTVGGLGMLIHQAARQQQIWLGRRPDVEVMTAAALRRLDARR
jgi:shikimate dehydrogenase